MAKPIMVYPTMYGPLGWYCEHLDAWAVNEEGQVKLCETGGDEYEQGTEIIKAAQVGCAMSESKPVRAHTFHMERDETGRAETTVTFLCPFCGVDHTRRESYLAIPANFEVAGYGLDCGHVSVAMPWYEG